MIAKLVVLMLLFLSIEANTVDVVMLAKKIDEIKSTNRISAKVNYDIYDPFLKVKPIIQNEIKSVSIKNKSQKIELQTILNSRAFIDGNWYDVGDKIQGYTINSIQNDTVVLFKTSKYITIKLKTAKDIITMTGLE